jgi:hypothetical protein
VEGDALVSGEARESPLRIVACLSIRRKGNPDLRDFLPPDRLSRHMEGFEGFGIRMWLKNCGSGDSVDKNPRRLTQRSSKNQRHWKRSESKVDSEVGKEAVSALRYRTFVEARLRTILYASPRSAKDGGGIS